VRVLIAEDLALLRDGLTRMLTAYGFEVVATVADGADLADRLVEIRPDVAVVDVRLPPTFTDEGLRAALQARRRVPGLPVLILSQYVEHLYAAELLSDRSGGVGYLLKDRVGDVRDFVSAVRQVASGGTVMDPEVVARLSSRPTTSSAVVSRTATSNPPPECDDEQARDEGPTKREEDLREVPGDPPARERARDLREQAPQAAAGVN